MSNTRLDQHDGICSNHWLIFHATSTYINSIDLSGRYSSRQELLDDLETIRLEGAYP